MNRPDELPFPAYEGDRPKVFVSYARKDSHLVYPEIRRLQSDGLPLWYDAHDLRPGHEWQAVIDHAILTCSCFLVFVTPAALASEHVLDEIRQALTADKPFVCVYWWKLKLPLEKLKLSPEIRERVPGIQAIERNEYHDSEYKARLRAALVDYVGEPERQTEHPRRDGAGAPAPPDLAWPLVCGMALLLWAVFFLFGVFAVAPVFFRTPAPTDPPLLNVAAFLLGFASFALSAVAFGGAFAVYRRRLRGKGR